MPRRFSSSAPVIAGLGFGTAVGVAVGAFALGPTVAGNPTVAGGGDSAVREQYRQTLEESHVQQAQLQSADVVLGGLSAQAVDGTLSERPVLVITTSNAQASEVDPTIDLLKAAGAEISGRIDLADKFFDPENADQIKTLISSSLPAGATLSTKNLDMGMHAGQALGAALYLDPKTTEPLATVDDRAALLQTLKSKGFLNYEDGTITPAQAIMVIDGQTGGEGNGFKANNLMEMMNGLRSVGNNAVLLAGIDAAGPKGPIGLLRATPDNEVSTVDSSDRSWARIAAVLAVREQLDGGFGSYGAAKNADAPSPVLGG